MEEGPHVPEVALERLELDAATDSQHLVNLDVPAEHRGACKVSNSTKRNRECTKSCR